MSRIIHTLLGVNVYWKVQIQPTVDSDYTDGTVVKHINITLSFLQEKYNNGLFTPKY